MATVTSSSPRAARSDAGHAARASALDRVLTVGDRARRRGADRACPSRTRSSAASATTASSRTSGRLPQDPWFPRTTPSPRRSPRSGGSSATASSIAVIATAVVVVLLGARRLRVRPRSLPGPRASCSRSSRSACCSRRPSRSCRCTSCSGRSACSTTRSGSRCPQAAFGLPLTIIILRPFFRSIPVELEDAAAIDGCSTFGFFWRILLPLSRPALATVAVLALVGSWNPFLLPL